MLAPTAITLRRPSGDSDLIISRLDSELHIDPASRDHRRPSEGCLLSSPGAHIRRPVSADRALPRRYEGRVSPGVVGTSGNSSPYYTSDENGPPTAETLSPWDSPRRRSSWVNRTDDIRKELDKLGIKLKQARKSLRGSADCLISRLHRRRKSSDNWELIGGRRFNVDLDCSKVCPLSF